MSMPAEACFSTTWRTALSISAAISAASNFSPASWRTSRSDSFSLRGRLPTWVVRMRSRLSSMRLNSWHLSIDFCHGRPPADRDIERRPDFAALGRAASYGHPGGKNMADAPSRCGSCERARTRGRYPTQLQFRRRCAAAQSRRRPRRKAGLYRRPPHADLSPARRPCGALRRGAARAGHPARGARADGAARHRRLADRVSRLSQGRRHRRAGQHAAHRGRLPLHAGRQPRQMPGGVGGAVSEIRKADRATAPISSTSSSPAANPHGYRLFDDVIGADEPEDYTAPTVADDMAFWLYTSGSTGKPKGAVHVHASLKLTADLYGTPIAGFKETDVVYSVAKLFFAYGLGNAMTFPLTVGATTVLLGDRPTPDGVAALLRQHPVTLFCAVPTFYAAFLASPNAPQEIGSENPPLHLGRRGAARADRQALEGALRHRHLRRPRHHRDAAHLSHQHAGRDQIRHHRQGGARLRDQADRRRRRRR